MILEDMEEEEINQQIMKMAKKFGEVLDPLLKDSHPDLIPHALLFMSLNKAISGGRKSVDKWQTIIVGVSKSIILLSAQEDSKTPSKEDQSS